MVFSLRSDLCKLFCPRFLASIYMLRPHCHMRKPCSVCLYFFFSTSTVHLAVLCGKTVNFTYQGLLFPFILLILKPAPGQPTALKKITDGTHVMHLVEWQEQSCGSQKWVFLCWSMHHLNRQLLVVAQKGSVVCVIAVAGSDSLLALLGKPRLLVKPS